MVFGKILIFLIGNVAEIRPLEMGRKSPGIAIMHYQITGLPANMVTQL